MVMKKKAWYDRVRDVSERPEFMTATIKIVDRSLLPEPSDNYDFETDTYLNVDDTPGIIYEGRARIISTRWGVDRNEDKFANPDTLSPVRVQVPRDDLPGIVKKGCIITVLSAPNEAVVGRPMSVTADFHGASAASRTIQCRMSGDVRGD